MHKTSTSNFENFLTSYSRGYGTPAQFLLASPTTKTVEHRS